MKTESRTEIAVFGLKPDGTWRKISTRFNNVVAAQQYLGEYIKDTEQSPDLYTSYAEYKIAKRTVTTTFTEWEDI